MLRATGCNLFRKPVAQAAKRSHMHAAMRKFQVAQRGQGCLTAVQRVAHARHQQTVLNGVQTLGTFRVPVAHVVFAAIGVGKVSGLVHNTRPCLTISGNVKRWIHNKNSNRW